MDALIVIFATGLLTMFIAMTKKPVLVLTVALIGLITAVGLFVSQWYAPRTLFNYDGLLFDQIAIRFSVLAVVLAICIILGGYSYLSKENEHTGEYISLLIFSLVGALCMIAFTDMFMFFLGLEIMSIPIYVMAGSKKQSLLSTEASVKYFFTGAFATGIFLFGLAWVYGATGTFKLEEIELIVTSGKGSSGLLEVGVLLMLASFLFKVGAAPFHFWGPDVYAGSPTVVTGFMASIVKLAGLFAFMKVFTFMFHGVHELWANVLYVLVMLTVVVGNFSALKQTKFKRLLAFSSIANAGYAIMAVMVFDVNSYANLFTYVLGYGFSIVSLITISVLVDNDEDEITSMKGIGRSNPIIGIAATVALLSLAGIPPLAGFFGKYMVFAAAFAKYPVMVIVAIITSGIGMVYYLKTLMTILGEPDDQVKLPAVNVLHYLVLIIATVASIIGGFLYF
jgi:NADH-quinone oxidoreductase subunit N